MARDYCCCAIPLLYAGITAALLEQLVLGLVAGILSIATPSIVGASTPSFAKWIFAIACWIGAAIQILGFIGAWQERPTLFRRYLTLHGLATVLVFGIAAAWIILSATRHSQAQTKCVADFFGNTVSATNSEGETLCNVFPWADVGIMGGLWVFFAIVQLYLFIVVSGFSKGQQYDHVLWNNKSYSSKNLSREGDMQNKNDTVPLTAARPSGEYNPYTSVRHRDPGFEIEKPGALVIDY